MSKKPVICMVSDHGCIRVFKEACALKEKGYEVHGMARVMMFGFNLFDTFTIYLDKEDLVKTVKNIKRDIDIFHCHNEPDWLVSAVREATQKPIVFDVHDLDSMRYVSEEPFEEEMMAFQDADAFVHVSQPCREYAEKIHGMEQKGKPAIVLYPWVNRRFIPNGDLGEPCWNSICYEGGLSSNGNIKIQDYKTSRVTFNMRYFAPMVDSFVNQGFNVGLYTNNTVSDLIYENLGAPVYHNIPYPTLLKALRMYGFGFVGACVSAPLMEAAMPNKLFEYLSQAVVPVVLFCGEAGDFVLREGLGIVLHDFNNLREKLTNGSAIRAIRHRIYNFVQLDGGFMEARIGGLEDLYKGLMS